METFEHLFSVFVQGCTIFVEILCVIVILVSVIRCLIALLRKTPKPTLKLAQGIALALQFKLGGEVLRILVVREWKDLLVLGAIILLSGLMTILIHWEITNECRQEHKEF